jgi:vacuolar iron transporter family protein
MILHHERHQMHRIGWLRATVLGANDGIVTMSSLLLGVAFAGADNTSLLVTGVATLVAGAMSMAAGEYVSVSSQADTEAAALRLEQRELLEDAANEHQELAEIYMARGLKKGLADEVARQLMAHDALGAHAQDELGIAPSHAARPILAAASSAAAFALGAFVPLLVALVTLWWIPDQSIVVTDWLSTLCFLAALGFVAAKVGNAPVGRSVVRILFWGTFAMAVTAAVGSVFGVAL